MSFVLFKILLIIILVIVFFCIIFFIIEIFPKISGKNASTLSMLIPFLFVLFLYIFIVDRVPVVYVLDKPDIHKSQVIFGSTYSYEQEDGTIISYEVESGGTYVHNLSENALIFYPIEYGTIEANENDWSFISGNSIEKVICRPDYFFGKEPDSISIDDNKKGEIRYGIDWSDNVLERLNL